MRVTDRIYRLGGILGTGLLGANVYLLLDTKLTVVDTGLRGRYRQILRQVKRLGYSPADIANIIITHHHADHVGSLAALKKITGAKVIAHPADAPFIDGTLPQPGPARPQWLSRAVAPFHMLWGSAPATADKPVNDGDELPILGGIQVFHTPGHTPGSICLYVKQEGVLIVGDVLVNRFGLRLPSMLFTADIPREIQSIKSLASLDYEVMCFGHGSPLRHRSRASVAEFAEKAENKYRSGP